MNFEQLKKNVGYLVRLAPPAHHLDAFGEALPVQDLNWTIMAVLDDYVEISTDSGAFYRLGKDHVRTFMTDPQRSTDGLSHGFLQLHVQLSIAGTEVTAVPNSHPGAPVPPPTNPALKARAVFIPELERVFRRQVQTLERVMVNFTTTALEMLGTQHAIRPNDTWESLRPIEPRLFPEAAAYRDLAASDAELLAEFYGAVGEVADIVSHWAGTVALTEYNAWNVLMHKVQNSLRLGALAVQRLCPDRRYDETIPLGGSLLSEYQRVLTGAEQRRQHVAEKLEAWVVAQSNKSQSAKRKG